jgi:hypothetical protein
MPPRPGTNRVTDPGPPPFHAYDHTRFAAWPEYRNVAQALDDLVQRINHDGVRISEDELEEMVVTIARHLEASDCCVECPPLPYRSHKPYRNTETDGSVAGHYRCAAGHKWTCSYAQRSTW